VDDRADYAGNVINVDGSRYFLAGLHGYDTTLTDPDRDAGRDPSTCFRMPADYLAAAMICLLPGMRYDHRP
jgi:hypothetical protein